MSGQQHRANFIPRTGIGRFDVECVPATGRMTIETCLYLNIMDTTDANAFKTQFAQAVPQTWNQKWKFTCVKPGFNNLTIAPQFRLSFENDFDQAHYVVNVSESIFGKEKVSRQDYYKAKGDFKPKTAQLGGMSSLQQLDFSKDIVRDLGHLFPFHAKCPVTSGSLSPMTVETLRRLGQQIASISANFAVYLKAGGGRATVNMGMVRQVLQAAGCTNILERKRTFKYNNEVVVTLKDDLESAMPAVTPVEFSYPSTVAHEYGHMLGLVDEYNCLSRTASDKLAQLSFIAGNEQTVYENLHSPTANKMENEFADSQREQIALCKEADVSAPSFGFKSASIMSSGRVVQANHMVTIWQCLVDMMKDDTAAADWKIVPY